MYIILNHDITKKLNAVSAVTAAVFIIKLPAPGITDVTRAVASAVAATAIIILFTVTKEFVIALLLV